MSTKWEAAETYALLGMCAEAAARTGTVAAFPRIRAAPAQLSRAEDEWLRHLTRLLASRRVARGAAVSPGTPPRPMPADERRTPDDWVGVPVSRPFVVPNLEPLPKRQLQAGVVLRPRGEPQRARFPRALLRR